MKISRVLIAALCLIAACVAAQSTQDVVALQGLWDADLSSNSPHGLQTGKVEWSVFAGPTEIVMGDFPNGDLSSDETTLVFVFQEKQAILCAPGLGTNFGACSRVRKKSDSRG
jgi:hypothetical protein